MAFERWFGGVDYFSNPSAWLPALVPQAGDTAIITTGTVFDTAVTAYTRPSTNLAVFAIAQAGSPPPVIASTYWSFDQSTVVLDNRSNTAVMSFTGGKYFSNTGSMEFVGGRFQLSQSARPVGTFDNAGIMSLVDADVNVASSAPFYDVANDGYLTFAGTTRFAGVIGGSGTTVIEPDAAVTLSKAVIDTQTVRFAGTSRSAVLTIAQPSSFGAALANVSQGDRIVLAGLTSTYSATYAADSANTGTLTLSSASQPSVMLRFVGSYQTSDFTLTQDSQGLSITTLRTDTRAPDPTGRDVRQVYRFFDTQNGTHFYTPSIAERDDIPATRSDMVCEGPVFADVDPASDPNAAPVYRFFDTGSGTHFLTVSQAERDQLRSGRPDLTFEGVSFYVHQSAQPGDVSVARFFSTVDGSHLYVENAGETATIKATRPDLGYEGVAFYAPKT